MKPESIFETYYFWFTQDGFYAEKRETSVSAGKNDQGHEETIMAEPVNLQEQLLETDRYRLLYECSFAPCPKNADVTGRFLLQAASSFMTALSRQPDIELLRENIHIQPDEEQLVSLLNAVPFANGSEYVTED